MRTLSNNKFDLFNESVLFKRLMLVSKMLVLTYPCFFIVDFVFFRNLDRPIFKFTLTTVHIIGLVISIVFLVINRVLPDKFRKGIIHLYILLYLLMGAVASISSQFFNGNVYAYIIILLGTAIVFPIRPRNLLFLILGVHLSFIAGLFLIDHSYYSFLSKMINTTGTAVVAFTISYSFYSYRKSDFSNRQKIKRNEETFRRLFDLNPNPLILLNSNLNEILLANKAADEYYLFQYQDLFNSPQEKLNIIRDLEKHHSIKNLYMEQHNRWSMLSFEYVDYMNERCVLMSSTDITDLKEREEMLYRHASIDALTGVLNRRSGMELLQGLLKDGQQEFILCYLDINNLKVANDRFGHSMGDDLIKTSCEIINRFLGKNDILFRLGGDEFVLIFFNRNMDNVQELLSSANKEFEVLHASNQKPYPVSVSHGLYHYLPGTPATAEEILERADQEMYKNKFLFKSAQA